MVSVVTPGISVGLLRVSVIILVRGKIRVDTIPKSFQPIGSCVVGTGGWVIGRFLQKYTNIMNIYAKEICKDVKT